MTLSAPPRLGGNRSTPLVTQNGTSIWFRGKASRRQDCHSADPPLPLVGVSIWIKRRCHQNDSLADG